MPQTSACLTAHLAACLTCRFLFQAEKFRSKAQKSDQFRSNAQYSRYLYYLGKIRTIQLEYTDAKECLQQVGCPHA